LWNQQRTKEVDVRETHTDRRHSSAAVDRIETLRELYVNGVELTAGGIDLFMESDARRWSWLDSRIAGVLN
jgi:hypothetical protein